MRILTPLFLICLALGCVPLDGDDAGLDGAIVGDGSPPDASQQVGPCDPQGGVVLDVENARDVVDAQALEAYQGAANVCLSSTVIAPNECVGGQLVDNDVCVPNDEAEATVPIPACSDTTFFIERPRWLAGPIPAIPACGSTLDGCMRTLLPLMARRNAYAWFCAPDNPMCRATVGNGAPLVAHMEPVLPVDDLPGEDLPRRAYRLWFEKNGARVPVRGTAACDLISTIRQLIPEDEALIGRECDATIHKATAVVQPDDIQATWHKTRMGLPASDSPEVPVVLIDAGVPRFPFVRALAELFFSGADVMAPQHRHGLGMALAIKDAAPNATILSMRVMNSNGRGNTADVARGIDRASRENAAVRIMNLSIGLAPETRMARVVRGPSCETIDDGVGESIALALEAARKRQPELLVFGAPGNRPIPGDAILRALIFSGRELVPPGASLRFDDPCRGAGIKGWFFPAMLARCNETAPIFGVGGINDRDQPTVVSIPGGEPALVAPAQHIFLNRAAPNLPIPRPDAAPICTPTGDGMPGQELPMVLTGTSLSAAFASGAAAWALGKDPSLTAKEVVRLLYLTGRPLCRPSADNIPVRAISLGRLDAAMNDPNFDALRACAGPDGDAWILPTLLDDCAAPLAALGLAEEGCERHDPIGWPDGYSPAACTGLETPGPADEDLLADCVMGCRAEVSERALGPGLVGKAGPQPEWDPCPECRLAVRLLGADVVDRLTLEVELSDVFEKSTTFEEPWLLVKNADTGELYAIDLDDYTTASDWTAGAVAKITDIPATKIPGGEDLEAWKTDLVPTIQMNVVKGGGGTPVLRTSPLRVDFLEE